MIVAAGILQRGVGNRLVSCTGVEDLQQLFGGRRKEREGRKEVEGSEVEETEGWYGKGLGELVGDLFGGSGNGIGGIWLNIHFLRRRAPPSRTSPAGLVMFGSPPNGCHFFASLTSAFLPKLRINLERHVVAAI